MEYFSPIQINLGYCSMLALRARLFSLNKKKNVLRSTFARDSRFLLCLVIGTEAT